MCRLFLIFAMLSGLVIGQCAIADGLMAVGSEASCASVEATDGPCCPDEPEPQCQCDDADASTLLSSVTILPVTGPTQSLLVHLVAPQTWHCQGYATVAARAPPGLKALRSVVLLI